MTLTAPFAAKTSRVPRRSVEMLHTNVGSATAAACSAHEIRHPNLTTPAHVYTLSLFPSFCYARVRNDGLRNGVATAMRLQCAQAGSSTRCAHLSQPGGSAQGVGGRRRLGRAILAGDPLGVQHVGGPTVCGACSHTRCPSVPCSAQRSAQSHAQKCAWVPGPTGQQPPPCGNMLKPFQLSECARTLEAEQHAPPRPSPFSSCVCVPCPAFVPVPRGGNPPSHHAPSRPSSAIHPRAQSTKRAWPVKEGGGQVGRRRNAHTA